MSAKPYVAPLLKKAKLKQVNYLKCGKLQATRSQMVLILPLIG